MGSNSNFISFLFVFSILFFSSSTVQFCIAVRPLHGEDIYEEETPLKKFFDGIKQSLQRGPVPPIGGSPCTYIPGGGGGHCPSLTGSMNFAGHVTRSPPTAPPALRNAAVSEVPEKKNMNIEEDASS